MKSDINSLPPLWHREIKNLRAECMKHRWEKNELREEVARLRAELGRLGCSQ